MTLNQIECFIVLAQQLNFTQAAEALFMAQPALSRTILALEREMDIQLFYRNSRSVSLTPAGQAFLKECPRILESHQRSLSAARLAQEGYRGEIMLGILRDAFDAAVVDIFQTVKQAYPEIHITVAAHSHSELYRRFSDGELDAIVDFGSSRPLEDIDSIVLRQDTQCVVLPSDSPLASAGHLRMDELKEEKFIAMSRVDSQPGHDFLWRMATDAGFIPNVVAEASHVPSLLVMVACGMGITTLTSDLAYLAQGRVVFVPLVGVPLSTHALVWHPNDTNPALPYFVDAVRQRMERRKAR